MEESMNLCRACRKRSCRDPELDSGSRFAASVVEWVVITLDTHNVGDFT